MIRSTLFVVATFLVFFGGASAADGPQLKSEAFDFTVDGNRLSGRIDYPADGEPKAIIILIHGYGATDIFNWNSFYDLRSRFAALGIASVVWDKPGCGKSEGTFDANQSVASSTGEVLAAIKQIRQRKIPGADRTGLWGISRAGWIAPLTMGADPSIAFWISVSGVDDKESFPYFLKSNLRIEGRTPEQIKRIVGEWYRGFAIVSQGGTFEAYLEATKNLRHDPLMLMLTGSPDRSRDVFDAEQQRFLSGEAEVDEDTGLMIYVPGFRDMLSSLTIPVLAIFGEKDMNVDWRKTNTLYAETIGQSPRASLTVKTFPDANHNIHISKTGGLREMLAMGGNGKRPEGYYTTMMNWLRTKALK